MDPESSAPLERSISVQSTTSITSYRSTARSRKRLTSQPSSSASSIAASDKSLTSFPSFSPESPRQERYSSPDKYDGATRASSPTPRSPSPATPHPVSSSSFVAPEGHERGQRQQHGSTAPSQRPASIVDSLVTTRAQGGGPNGDDDNGTSRDALFGDDLLPLGIDDGSDSRGGIPSALHQADDDHIERVMARHGGALALVRRIAEDLARRDAAVATLRRRAEERERALRKIILECGLSSLDLETRLRAVEAEARENERSRRLGEVGDARRSLETLMNEAMANDVGYIFGGRDEANATIRAASSGAGRTGTVRGDDAGRGTVKGWKEFLWGSGTAKRATPATSVNGDAPKSTLQTVVRTAGERRPGLQDILFKPPDEEDLVHSPSRASSIHSGQGGRKTSLANLALRLVIGGATSSRVAEPTGRKVSTENTGSLRASSVSNVQTPTSASVRAASTAHDPKALMAMRRTLTGRSGPANAKSRAQTQDRRDTAETITGSKGASQQESLGPVEMDTILPPETQPPTLSHIYSNYNGSDYLTDRFGFIYDQRRKKRQREATDSARQMGKGKRHEMLTKGRNGLSPIIVEDDSSAIGDMGSDGRPDTPSSLDDARDDSKPKRWQDYLRVATFPTELLSHTPSISVPGFEVMEGGEGPRSPGLITADERGFVPSASRTAAVDSEGHTVPEPEQASGTLVKEDAEPVKLLLQQLSELHDSLQREKEVRWNDFLRKVRAERKREGEAAAVAAAAAAEARFERATAVMPETTLGDGELIGVASLGVQGKVGRAKANEFKQLILGGIPVAYRAKIWSECSGARALRVPSYYEDLVNGPEEQHDPQIVSQIKADITRTLTDNIFFRKGPGVAKLNEVLLAYSRRNHEVGYCQGMNLVAANLLLIMPTAEDAFWVLTSIIENILPPGYFDHSLLACRADQQVLRSYVAEVLPRLSQHFDHLSIDLETMTFQWFLSVFTDCLSAEALFRLWDVVLCMAEGGAFLFQVALALLKLNEPALLGCVSPAAVYTYINHQMTNHAISIDGLIQASEGLRRVVRPEDIENRRKRAIQAEEEQLRKREERNASRRAELKPAAVAVMTATGQTSSLQERASEAEVTTTTMTNPSALVATLPESENGPGETSVAKPTDADVSGQETRKAGQPDEMVTAAETAPPPKVQDHSSEVAEEAGNVQVT